MDRLDQVRRSWNMSRIRSRNTAPEVQVRSILHSVGFRFRLHRKDLPGKPDIVLPKREAVVFVHGCFWHRHPGCKNCTNPKTNADFWQTKFGGNVARDEKTRKRSEGRVGRSSLSGNVNWHRQTSCSDGCCVFYAIRRGDRIRSLPMKYNSSYAEFGMKRASKVCLRC